MTETETFDAVILRAISRAGQRLVSSIAWPRAIVLLLAIAALARPREANAHEIPATVMLRIFVRPETSAVRIVVRAPLEAMRDIDFPLRDRYLDVAKAEPLIRQAATTWVAGAITLYEGDSIRAGRVVAARVSLPSDRAFGSYASAVAHFHDPALATGIDLPWQQAMLDVEIEYPIRSAGSRFSIDPALARLGVRTTTVLTYVSPNGDERPFEYIGDPGVIRLDPSWINAVSRFVRLGFDHILGGIDHLLFIFCLVIPFRRIKPLIGVITAFTVAHSITLIASTFGLAPSALWFPPLIEMLIALSILYMALENIIGAKLERRWVMAFLFGLVHGFGFAVALRDSLQFAGRHLALSLFSFNVGVEMGQLLLLVIVVPLLTLAFTHVVTERMGTIILSAFVAHTAWHWTADRWEVVRRFNIAWHADVTSIVSVVALGVLVAAAGFGPRLLRGRAARISADAA